MDSGNTFIEVLVDNVIFGGQFEQCIDSDCPPKDINQNKNQVFCCLKRHFIPFGGLFESLNRKR